MTAQEDRDRIIREFELEYEQFSPAQKRNYEKFSEYLDSEIPKTIGELRKEIKEKIKNRG